MPASPDPSLLREVAALRDCLAECFRQLDHLEHRLRTQSVPNGTESVPDERRDTHALAGPSSDPFEQTLPAGEKKKTADRPPHTQGTPDRFTIRALPLPDDPHGGPESAAPASRDPFADSAPTPVQEPHRAGWEEEVEPIDSGDGSLDPFAFLCVPTLASSSDDTSGIYRGMHALLGGLDVTTQDEPA